MSYFFRIFFCFSFAFCRCFFAISRSFCFTFCRSFSVFAFNNYDVNKAVSGDNQWNLGINTLGLGLPAGNRGDFCEIIVGEQYTFGEGNFSATVANEAFAIIANGLLTPAADAPASGVYFEILRTVPVNQGAEYVGLGYILRAVRA